MEADNALVLAVIEKLGGPSKAAAALGLKPNVILNWRKRGAIPPARVLDVERLTGISRYELRADIFGDAEHSGA